MTVQPESSSIYLASIALEPNRWKKDEDKMPSFAVSDWARKASEAGFKGWELWEHHYFRSPSSEQESLVDMCLPVRIFNTYLRPAIDADSAWEDVVNAVRSFNGQVRGIKFNLGADVLPWEAQADTALKWSEQLPPEVRMLCECHPGTVIEEPGAAVRAFARWPAERFGAIVHPLKDDPGHCQRWFDALGGRIEHLHWQPRDSSNRVCAMSSRPEILDVAINTLQENRFRGSQSIEFVEGTGIPGETVEGLFEAAVRDLKTLRSHHLVDRLSGKESGG